LEVDRNVLIIEVALTVSSTRMIVSTPSYGGDGFGPHRAWKGAC
jgi:hypothetical protein